MFSLNKYQFILSSIACVDLAMLISYFLYLTVHPVIDETTGDKILTGFFVGLRIMFYLATIFFFFADFDNCQYMMLVLLPMFFVDLNNLIMSASDYKDFPNPETIIVRSLFVALDSSYAFSMRHIFTYIFVDREKVSDEVIDEVEKDRPNTTFISYIMYFDGIFLVFYIITLSTFSTQVFSGWYFVFDVINLYVALEITLAPTQSELKPLLRTMLGVAVISAAFFLVCAVVIDEQGHHQYGGVTAFRALIITCSFLYILASFFHLFRFDMRQRASTMYVLINQYLPPLLLFEFFLIFAYIIFDATLPSQSFNWFVFIHLLDTFVGVMVMTSGAGSDLYFYLNMFGIAACLVAVYEALMLTFYVDVNRNPAVLTFEAVLLFVPFLYLLGVSYVWMFIDPGNRQLRAVYITLIDIYDDLNQLMWLMPLFRLPALLYIFILSYAKSDSKIPELTTKYDALDRTSRELPSPEEKEQLQLLKEERDFDLALALDRAIHLFFCVPYLLDIACLLAYVLGLIPSKKYEHWGAYGNIFHILTVLGGYYVLTGRANIQKALMTQTGFSIFLFLWDLIYLIDFYALQWFGSHYSSGFIVLRFFFVFIDVMYVVQTSAMQYGMDMDVYLCYAGFMSVDMLNDILVLQNQGESVAAMTTTTTTATKRK